MKKFFAAAMAVVAMASVMASCSNGSNDMVNEIDPANKPSGSTSGSTSTYSSMNLYFPLLATQSEHFTDEVTVESSAGKQTFSVYDLQTATDIPSSFTSAIETTRELKGQYIYKVYTLKGSFKAGDEIKVTCNATVKAPFSDFQNSGVAYGVALYGQNGSQTYLKAPLGVGNIYGFDLERLTADEVMSHLAEVISTVGSYTFTVK